jgi:hypothetical protein
MCLVQIQHLLVISNGFEDSFGPAGRHLSALASYCMSVIIPRKACVTFSAGSIAWPTCARAGRRAPAKSFATRRQSCLVRRNSTQKLAVRWLMLTLSEQKRETVRRFATFAIFDTAVVGIVWFIGALAKSIAGRKRPGAVLVDFVFILPIFVLVSCDHHLHFEKFNVVLTRKQARPW